KLISTLEERLEIIGSIGIDLTVVLPFTYEFSRQSSREFYERCIVESVGVREVVEGHDHMFGRDREADIDQLRTLGQSYGFNVIAASPVTVDGDVVSSSKIREALMRGEVAQAGKYLDRPYTITGIVVRGDGRGKQLGFPTANIRPASEKKVVPAEGVYVVSVAHDARQFNGMLNIGVRPTFSSTLDRVIEVHLFDFQEDLYGKQLTIQFHKRLRQERKFSSKEELVAQLLRDREECMKYIGASQPV
ncbi:MAG TPA: riboflavin biosynthesis protein RibF, partial [Bacteroidota bacterium]|nr:riboflavin biosynthesis protein RibF [Bacteroidota bacterium]